MARAIPVEQAKVGNPANGEKVYAAQKCSNCHRIATVGGALGPDLSNTGATREAAWLDKLLRDPKSVNPKAVMPAVTLTDDERRDLVAYLRTLKKR
jgi:mono/diheme cytochrome c family protein